MQLASDLEAALISDVTTATTKTDSFDQDLLDANARAEELTAEASGLKEEFEQSGDNSREIRQQGNRKARRRRA